MSIDLTKETCKTLHSEINIVFLRHSLALIVNAQQENERKIDISNMNIKVSKEPIYWDLQIFLDLGIKS